MEQVLGNLRESVARQNENGERPNFRFTMKFRRTDSLTITKKLNRPDSPFSLKSLMKISTIVKCFSPLLTDLLIHHLQPHQRCCPLKCEEFTTFFNDKIIAIRQNISASVSTNEPTLQFSTNITAAISHFVLLDLKKLDDIVGQLRSSTCCLDPLPTTFFKTVFNCLAHDVLEIINRSLQSGIFPAALKTAVIKPLLKKSNLDATVTAD